MYDFEKMHAVDNFVSRQVLHNVLDSITDGFCFLGKDWRIRYWNKTAEKITLRTSCEMVNQNLWDVYAGAENTSFYRQCHKAAAENIPVEFEIYYNVMNIWLEIRAFPSSEGLAIYLKDITAKKNHEIEIELQRAQQEAIINATTDMIWSVDKNLRLTLCNKAFKNIIYDAAGEELRIGACVFEKFNVVEEAFWRPLYEQALAGEEVNVERFYKPNGIDFWMDIKMSPIVNAVKEVLGVACFTRDITTYKKLIEAEIGKQKSEQLLSMVMDKGVDMLGIIDADGNYKYVSSNVKRIMGYEVDELIGKNVLSFIHEEDRPKIMDELARAATYDEIFVEELRFPDAQGCWRYVEVICINMLHNPALQGILIDSRDITARKEAEQQLKKAFVQLQEQNHALQEISYMQAHDVRRPLANLLGLIQLLKTKTVSRKETESCLDMITRSAEELDCIIKKIITKSNLLRDSDSNAYNVY